MLNPDCSQCDNRANVLTDDDAVGLFEGAKYYHCGRFRSSYRCRMRNSNQNFCRVCVEAIAARTSTYVAATPTLEVSPLTLAFGDVADGLTLYLPFEVRNVRNGRPGALRVELAPPTGEFHYAPGTELSFTLPAPIHTTTTSRLVFVAYTSSATAGPAPTGSVVVTTPDDPANPSVTVSLSAHPVPPPPVDSVLVIDRSDSMEGNTGVVGVRKIDMAIEAAELYVSLLKDNDRIGVVRYNHVSGPGDILLTMRPAGPSPSGAGRLAAYGVLDTTHLDRTVSPRSAVESSTEAACWTPQPPTPARWWCSLMGYRTARRTSLRPPRWCQRSPRDSACSRWGSGSTSWRTGSSKSRASPTEPHRSPAS